MLYAPLMFLAGSVSKWSLIFLAPLFAWLIVALVMNSESVAKWDAYVNHHKVKSMKETMGNVAGIGRSMPVQVPVQARGIKLEAGKPIDLDADEDV